MPERLLTKKDRAIVCRLFPDARWSRSGSRVGFWEVRGHEIRSFSKLMKIAQHYHVLEKLPPQIQDALKAIAAAPPAPEPPKRASSSNVERGAARNPG